jgi:pimeloyl-ACP methyl ester carboxylesterase
MAAIDFDIRRLERRASRLDPKWTVGTREGIRILELPTARVRVRVAGRGEMTLVFATDMPNVVESYDHVIGLLETDYRIVVFEQVGFGFSYPKRGFTFTRRAYVDAMADMLNALGMAPYTLVSPCVNVFTALSVAKENPSLVKRLVLMQAVEWNDQCKWAGWAIDRFMLAVAFMPRGGKEIVSTRYLGQWAWASAERRLPRRTHPHVIYRSKERPELFRRITDPLYAAHEHGACSCFASSFQNYFHAADQIPVVSQPVLILWATADRGHAKANPKALRAYAPHAVWVEVPDTGHHLDLENPEAVTHAIRRFMNS